MATATASRLSLSDTEMDYLLALPGADRLLAIWRMLMPGEFDTAPSVEPTEYAIPREQWVAVCPTAFEDGAGMWLNVGPSSY